MEAFDPYHKWLGIPRDERPPNHYQLLGISLFESDPDVIDASARRQLDHLGRCAMDTNLMLIQQLRQELADARDCLLLPTTRREYNSKLRASLGWQGDAAAHRGTPNSVMTAEPSPQIHGEPDSEIAFEPPPDETKYVGRPRDTMMLQLVIGTMIGGAFTWGIYFWLGCPHIQIRHTEKHFTVEIVRTNHDPAVWNVW